MLEITATALNYNCRLARDMLAGDGLRCFLFEGCGSPIRTPIWQAARSISQAGLCFAYNDGLFPILVRSDAKAAETAYHLPNPGNDEGEAAWHPPIFINPESPITRTIQSGRAALQKSARYGEQDFDAMLKGIVGRGDDLSTDDEKFLAYCSRISAKSDRVALPRQAEQSRQTSVNTRLFGRRHQ
jgi:hypothetical protein